MAQSVPVYQIGEKTYHPDNCQPLVDAVAAGQVHLQALARGGYPGNALSRNTLPQLQTIGYWDARGPQDWGLPWHRHEGVEFGFLESGAISFGIENNRHAIKAGDLIITLPWQLHEMGDPRMAPCRFHWVLIDVGVRRPNQSWRWPDWLVMSPRDVEEFTRILRYSEQPVWWTNEEMRACYRRIARAVDTDRENRNESLIAVYVNELLLHILSMLRQEDVQLHQTQSAGLRTVQLFLTELRSHAEYLQMPWSINTMAGQCGLGTTQFSNLCKLLTNMTPVTYLNHCRTEAAANLLQTDPRLTITDIAFSCGFSSSQYFATVFRRHMGCNPHRFRTQAVNTA